MQTNSKLYTALASAGTFPFIAGALLPLFGYTTLPLIGSTDAVVASYGLAIICFLAGAHWGTFLVSKSAGLPNLFVTSNVVFLVVWFAYIGASLKTAVVMQIIAFLLLLLIDRHLVAKDVVSAGYFHIRTVATLIATLSLLVSIAR